MKRVRFFVPYSAADLALQETDENHVPDTRPMKWPTPYPAWCSGSSDTYDIYVAYTPEENHEAYLREYWPEATEFDVLQEGVEIQFSSRFARNESVYDEQGRAYQAPYTAAEKADDVQLRNNGVSDLAD